MKLGIVGEKREKLMETFTKAAVDAVRGTKYLVCMRWGCRPVREGEGCS